MYVCMYVQNICTERHARKANKQQDTYTWLSLTFLSPWLTSSVSSFQTLMPSFLLRSCETLILLARTCLRVCISSSTWNWFSLLSVLGTFSDLRDLPLLTGRSIQPFVFLAPPKRALGARSPWYPMMATESRPSGARHLHLEQKRRRGINRQAYGTMTVTLTARRITFLASRLQFNTDYYITCGKITFTCTYPT